MAHVGKLYPLSLRRDFQYDLVNYRTGNAKVYLLNWNATFGSLGDFLNTQTWRLSIQTFNAAKELDWRSPVASHAGFTFYVRLWGHIDQSIPHLAVKVDIVDTLLGLLFRTHEWDRPQTFGPGANYPSEFFPDHETAGVVQQKFICSGNYAAEGW